MVNREVVTRAVETDVGGIVVRGVAVNVMAVLSGRLAAIPLTGASVDRVQLARLIAVALGLSLVRGLQPSSCVGCPSHRDLTFRCRPPGRLRVAGGDFLPLDYPLGGVN